MKTCTGCGEHKPVADFYSDGKGYLRPRCKRCHLTASRAYESANRVQVTARARVWRQNNKSHSDECRRLNRLKNADVIKAQHKAERVRNVAAWRRRDRAYKDAHPGLRTRTFNRWREKYPDKYLAWKTNQRRRRKGARGSDVSAADMRQMMAAQGGRCLYCSTELNGVYHVDHKVPLARGGEHCAGNLCLACPSCNLRKHTQTAEEFQAA